MKGEELCTLPDYKLPPLALCGRKSCWQCGTRRKFLPALNVFDRFKKDYGVSANPKCRDEWGKNSLDIWLNIHAEYHVLMKATEQRSETAHQRCIIWVIFTELSSNQTLLGGLRTFGSSFQTFARNIRNNQKDIPIRILYVNLRKISSSQKHIFIKKDMLL